MGLDGYLWTNGYIWTDGPLWTNGSLWTDNPGQEMRINFWVDQE